MLSLILSLLVAAAPKASLSELEFCDNPLAPAWKQSLVYPGQVFSVRYQLHHLQSLGKEATLGFVLLSSSGEKVLDSSIPMSSLPQGKSTNASYVSIQLPHSVPAGELQMVMQATGNGQKLEQKKALQVKPTQLGFAMCSVTYDAEGKVPASLNRLTVFQTVQIHFSLTGVGVDKNFTKIRAQMQVLNEAGETMETIKLPESQQPALPIPGEKTAVQGGRFHLSIDLPGKYRVKLRIEDLNTWDVASKELALQFLPPE